MEIDAHLSKLAFETKRVMSLINPADTYMVKTSKSLRTSHHILQDLMTSSQSVVQNYIGP